MPGVCVCVYARGVCVCICLLCMCVCVSVPPHRVAFCCLSMKKKKFRRRCWRRLRCSPPWLVDGAATLRMRSVSRRESRWMQHSALTHGADQTRFRALLSRFAIVCAFASSRATQSNIATTTATTTIIATTITATRDNEDNQVCPLCVQRATCVSRESSVQRVLFLLGFFSFFFLSPSIFVVITCVCATLCREQQQQKQQQRITRATCNVPHTITRQQQQQRTATAFESRRTHTSCLSALHQNCQ